MISKRIGWPLIKAGIWGLLVLLFTQPVSAKPFIIEERKYYSFTASSRQEIWQQIQANSPRGVVEKAGEHLVSVAVTEARLSGRYQYQASLTRCKLLSYEPHLKIIIHMPHWENSWQASQQLVDNWNNYVRMVSNHEDIHRQYAIKMVEEFDRRLGELAHFKRCNELKEAIEQIRQEVIGTYRAQNAWFDAKERVYQKNLRWF